MTEHNRPSVDQPARLIDRLVSRGGTSNYIKLLTEADAEIERLRSENWRLRAELSATYNWLSAFEGDQTVTVAVNDLDAVRWRIRYTIEGRADG